MGREKEGGKVVGGGGTKSDGLRGPVNGLWIYEWPTSLSDTKASATNEHSRVNSIWKSAYRNIDHSFELIRDSEPPTGRDSEFSSDFSRFETLLRFLTAAILISVVGNEKINSLKIFIKHA